MRKTNLRTPQTHAKYESTPKDPNFMVTAPSIVDYTYWRVIENTFPYDNMASTHHLLVPRRQFSERKDMKKKERMEFDTIIDTYLEEYDCVVLNLPGARTVPGWLHFHLIVLKRT